MNKNKTVNKIGALVVAVFLCAAAALFVSSCPGKSVSAAADSAGSPFVTAREGSIEVSSEAVPRIKLKPSENGGNVEFAFTQLLSADMLDGSGVAFDFDIGAADFQSRSFMGLRVDFTDSEDDGQMISVGITSRGTASLTDLNAGVTVGFSKAEPRYGSFWLDGSYRRYVGNFYGNYDNYGSHYGGVAGNLTGPREFAIKIDNETAGGRKVSVAGIYDESKNIASQEQVVASFDADEYKNLYFTDAGGTHEVGELFASGFVRVSVKAFGVVTTGGEPSIGIHSIGDAAIGADGFEDMGPKIAVAAETDALVGVPYALPEPIRIFDELDGADVSDYSVKVLGPSLGETAVENGRFTPSAEGVYKIIYSAADSVGNTGEKILEVKAVSVLPPVTFDVSDEMPGSEYALGETVFIPSCAAYSALSLKKDGSLKVLAVVEKDGSPVAVFDASGRGKFVPTDGGKYTVKYLADCLGFGQYCLGGSFTVSVRDAIIGGDDALYSKTGSRYVFDNTYGVNGTQKKVLSPSVVSPSGKTVALDGALGFVCDEIGYYSVRYSFGGAEKNFKILSSPSAEDFFETDRIDSIEPCAVIPDYASDGGKTGLMIRTSSIGSSVSFKNKIDLGSLTKHDNLLSLVPYSDGADYAMFYLQIELTDAHNPSNKVVLSVNPHAEGLAEYAYVNVNYDGRTLARSPELGGGIMSSGYHGALIVSSFGTGSARRDVPPFEIQFDLEDNTFYVQSHSGNGQWELLDLDDPMQVGSGREWGGFTNGEVYMRLTFNQINGGKAGIILTEVAGSSMSGSFIPDGSAPSLYVTYPNGYVPQDGAMPDALVGSEYSLPSASAYDFVCGETDVSYELYYNGGNENLASSVSGGLFVPAAAGKYEYVISATDAFGNSVRKSITFTAKDVIAPIEVVFGAASAAQAGTWFDVPGFEVSGGTGDGTYSLTVDVTLNGRALTVGANGQVFISEKGKLKIAVTVSDYVGSAQSSEAGKNGILEIDVKADSEPVITAEGVPEYAFEGRPIVLCDFTAINYAADTPVNLARYIEVDGKTVYSVSSDGTVSGSLSVNGDWKAGDVVNVKFVSGNSYIEKQITVKASPVYVSDYLISSSAAVTRGTVGSRFEFVDTESNFVSAVYPLAANGMTLRFSAVAEQGVAPRVRIVMTDFHDGRNEISFAVTTYGSGVAVSANGKIYTAVGSFTADGSGFYFRFNNARRAVLDSFGNSVCVIENNAVNEKFAGFASGAVKVRFEIENVSAFTLLQLGNQMYSASSDSEVFADAVGAEAVILGEVNRTEVALGETVEVPAARAYDAVSAASTVKVSVIGPDGRPIDGFDGVSCEEKKSFTANAYGNYLIRYTPTDGNGIDGAPVYFYVYAKDTEPPVITVRGDVITSAKTGQTVTFPGAEVTDNNVAPSLYLLIRLPDGSVKKIADDGSYTFTAAGTYRLTYYAYDADYNVTVKEFTIIVG